MNLWISEERSEIGFRSVFLHSYPTEAAAYLFKKTWFCGKGKDVLRLQKNRFLSLCPCFFAPADVRAWYANVWIYHHDTALLTRLDNPGLEVRNIYILCRWTEKGNTGSMHGAKKAFWTQLRIVTHLPILFSYVLFLEAILSYCSSKQVKF